MGADGSVESADGPAKPGARGWRRWAEWVGAALLLAIAGVGTWGLLHYRLRAMPVLYKRALPEPNVVDGVVTLAMPNGNLVGEVGSYGDELAAYLRFNYLQGVKALSGTPVLMTERETGKEPVYTLHLILHNDVLSESDRLAKLQIERYIPEFKLESPPESQLQDWKEQTRLFEAAYKTPVHEALLELPRSALEQSVARFVLFKLRTDARVRMRTEPAAAKISSQDSMTFAADMIDVAKFYNIPLEMLLGIGAMENNYLNVDGDLQHAVWKRRAQKGDIVLKRRRGRVLVSNYSQGPWQITRETLRYAHALYLKDREKRDYIQLPERLRPPLKLDLNDVDPHVLTTYAGLLLRNLLDYYHGDVAKAEGAYNGGVRRPNMKYAEGVEIVATYAHRVVSISAARRGIAVEKTADGPKD